MIISIVIAILGLGGLVLGGLQLSGALPTMRRSGTFPRYTAIMNIVVGIFLLALAALRAKGLL